MAMSCRQVIVKCHLLTSLETIRPIPLLHITSFYSVFPSHFISSHRPQLATHSHLAKPLLASLYTCVYRKGPQNITYSLLNHINMSTSKSICSSFLVRTTAHLELYKQRVLHIIFSNFHRHLHYHPQIPINKPSGVYKHVPYKDFGGMVGIMLNGTQMDKCTARG